MKALISLAVAMTSAPVLAVTGADAEADNQQRERKVCTRVEQRGASRLAYRRVCLTAAQWQDRLGPDWRQHLNGANSVDDELADVETRTRVVSDMPTDGMSGGGPR